MSADVKLVASGGSTLPSVRAMEALEMAVDSALKVVDAIRPCVRLQPAATPPLGRKAHRRRPHVQNGSGSGHNGRRPAVGVAELAAAMPPRRRLLF
jgi:hypothetical protein